MARNWTRLEQRRYREQRREFAAKCAARLMGKKETLFQPGDEWKWQPLNGGNQIISPIQYGNSFNVTNGSPRLSVIFPGGIST